MSDRLSAAREAEIATRAAHLYEYSSQHHDEWDELAGEDVPALLAELAAVRAERDQARAALREAADQIAELQENLRAVNAGWSVARARVAELEQAAEQIRHLHKDSPMGPCPVCIDADAMARGEDYTVPYPCPTARLAGAKECDPPSFRIADRTEEAS